MEKRKRTLRPLELWNPGAIEKWLEDEAARGWQLTDCGRVLATFTAVEPGAYRVRLRPRQPAERTQENRIPYLDLLYDSHRDKPGHRCKISGQQNRQKYIGGVGGTHLRTIGHYAYRH